MIEKLDSDMGKREGWIDRPDFELGVFSGGPNPLSGVEPLRRGRFDIAHDILSVARDPSTKTKIAKTANLSFSQAERYLSLLLENDLIECSGEGEKKTYERTGRGNRFLKYYSKLDKLVSRGSEAG